MLVSYCANTVLYTAGISCSGASTGTIDAVMQYLKLMHDLFLGIVADEPPPGTDGIARLRETEIEKLDPLGREKEEAEAKTEIGEGTSNSAPILPHKLPQCERNGVDQGIHNVLVHMNMIENLEIRKEAQVPYSSFYSK